MSDPAATPTTPAPAAAPKPSWLEQALSDGENISCSRVIAVAVVIFCVLVPMALWTVISITKRQMQEIPGSLTGFMGAASTLSLTLLHLNKREETRAQIGG